MGITLLAHSSLFLGLCNTEATGLTKISFIRKMPKGYWGVFSEKGKLLGKFKTRTQAAKRLKQIEYFKHTKGLWNTANEFKSIISSKVSVIKNNNEVLKEMSDLKEYEDRVELAEENFDKLGEGSSRTIFQISDSFVLKVAHCEAGVAQNKAEMSIRGKCLNNVLAADPEGKWIVVRFSDTMKEDDFKDITGISFKSFMGALYYFANNEVHDGKPNDYDDIIEHPMFKCLSHLVMTKQLQVGDIAKASSWGLVDGKPLLRDFGLTKDVFIDFYEGKSGNETSTP